MLEGLQWAWKRALAAPFRFVASAFAPGFSLYTMTAIFL